MNLKRLEASLRTLVESQLIRALPGQRPEDRVAQRLIEAMDAGTQLDRAGNRIAPNVYTLLVHPDSLSYWRDPHLLETITEIVSEAAGASGSRLAAPPSIALSPDASRKPGEFLVVASHEVAPINVTQDLVANTPAAVHRDAAAAIPENAFLIVDGSQEYELSQPVVNIGRRLDNNLVIEDPRVSRHHAQLRAIEGQFVLFDLNSSGGTFVNGQRRSQSVLHAGDVVSLAGVSLIYSQDTLTPHPHTNHTAPRPRADAETPNAASDSMPSGDDAQE